MSSHPAPGHSVSRAEQLADPEHYGLNIDAEGESDPECPRSTGNLSDAGGSNIDGEYPSDPVYPGPAYGHHGGSPVHAPASIVAGDLYTPRSFKERMSPETYRARIDAVVEEAREKIQSLIDHVYEDVSIIYTQYAIASLNNRMTQITAWKTTMLGERALERLSHANAAILDENFTFLQREIETMSTSRFHLVRSVWGPYRSTLVE